MTNNFNDLVSPCVATSRISTKSSVLSGVRNNNKTLNNLVAARNTHRFNDTFLLIRLHEDINDRVHKQKGHFITCVYSDIYTVVLDLI